MAHLLSHPLVLAVTYGSCASASWWDTDDSPKQPYWKFSDAPPPSPPRSPQQQTFQSWFSPPPPAPAPPRPQSFWSPSPPSDRQMRPPWWAPPPPPAPPPYVWNPPPPPPRAPGIDVALATEEWGSLIGLCLVIYGGLFAVTRFRTLPGTAQRITADRLLCCWPELYTGRAFPVYTIIFSPILLMVHACRIYLPSCLLLYMDRISWLACGFCIRQFFEDSEFPPNARSLGDIGGDDANKVAGKSDASVVWVRAMNLGRKLGDTSYHRPKLHDTDMCLFEGKIEPADVAQGALGDCWLLAALATLAGREGAINQAFISREIDPRGKYYVRLFDPQEKRWKIITVDDYVPCQRDPQATDGIRRGPGGLPELMFARPNGHEIWAIILEKAIAKLCGSYANIEGGITEWGLQTMTGGDAWRYTKMNSNEWVREDLVAMEGEDKRRCGFLPKAEKHSSSELFDIIRYYHRNGAVLSCGGVEAAGEARGLVAKHAFSLLQVETVRKSQTSKQFFRFVQVRNPWGTGEWTGAWSDQSPEWQKFPYVKATLRQEESDDGKYWMQWEDFIQYWGYIGVVDCTTDIFSLRPPVYDETDRLGPLKSCLQGCFDYWCCCLGAARYMLHHDADSSQISAREIRRTVGADQKGFYCRVLEREVVHVGDDGSLLRVDDPDEFRP